MCSTCYVCFSVYALYVLYFEICARVHVKHVFLVYCMCGMNCMRQVLKVMAKKLVRKTLEMIRKLASTEVEDEEASEPTI